MQNRREPRFPLQMPTLVSGFDRKGRAFIEQAQTLDISVAGARLTGLSSEVSPGTILAVKQGDRRARFQVLWVGEQRIQSETHLGLRCVEIGGHTQKRILYIEPEVAEQALRRAHLETAGYEVVCRADLREGMEIFQESAFDLLLLDCQSQHGTMELIDFVRQNSPRTRIVLMSDRVGHIPELLLNHSDGFIQKSNSRHELLGVVEEMVGPSDQIRWPLPRLAARYALDVPVRISPHRGDAPVNWEGKCVNISELGLGVQLAQDLALGELLNLQFRLPDSDHDLTPRAMVRRRMGSLYGLEFVSIECTRLEEIRLACQTLSRVSLPQPI